MLYRYQKGFFRILVTSVAMATPLLYAHGGGLDKYGCHNNRKVGNYHCHRGQFAGRSFSSQAEMLKLLYDR
jgi:hypothetical protein